MTESNPLLPHDANPELLPYCSFCLRERPPDGATFHAYDILNSLNSGTTMEDIVGFELEMENFTICTPCWKVVQLVENFRMCCYRANWAVKNFGGGGMKFEDDWFSEQNERAIEGLKDAIQCHVDKVEEMFGLSGGDDEQAALSMEIKIEPTQIEDRSRIEEAEEQNSVETETESSSKSDVVDLKVIQCKNCQRYFDSDMGLRTHLTYCKVPVEKVEPLPHQCHLCPVSFNFPESLRGHLNKHTGDKPYKCRVQCDKSFHSKALRKEHESLCSAEKLNCKMCENKFSSKISLNRHMKKVHVEPSFPCEICGALFKTVFCRNRHRDTQHFEHVRNFPCKICAKMFKTAYAVRTHMLVHEEKLPDQFPCAKCDRKFSNKRTYLKHVRRWHQEKTPTIGCDTCGRKFFRECDLLKHMKIMHCVK